MTRHGVYGFEQEVNRDFVFYLAAHSENTGYLKVGYISTDSVNLELNEDVLADQSFRFRLEFLDSDDRKYVAEIINGRVKASGKFLWRVQLASQDRGRRK